MARKSGKRGRITPPSRPVWTGTIRLSLVSIPVHVFTGLDREADTHFHQIHRETGKRVRYQKMVPGFGPVEQADIVKGYEFEKGQYIVVEPDDAAQLGRGSLALLVAYDEDVGSFYAIVAPPGLEPD